MLADLKDMLINFLTFWGFILFTVLCWFTFQFNRKDSFSYAVLKSFAFTSFQFYIVDLILSVFSVLRFAVVVNMLISAILIMLSLKKLSEILGVAKQKVFSFISAIGRRNLVLSLMVLAFYMYLGVISYYFPVRGTDDLGYRLPIILESVRKSGIVIPSPKCDARFAFPQFTYPIYKIYLLITGGERFLDFTNIYFLLILIISVYCISVFVRARTDVAFFMSSLLLPVTPVVVGQTTSNYVDLAFASFLIGAIAIALKLVKGAKKEGKERNISDAVACGIFLGGLCGIKYTGLFFIPLVEYFIILSGNVRIFVVFNVVLFITMCFWYFVNLVNFGFPIWPVPGSPLDPYPNITKFSLHEVKHLLAFLKYDNIELSYHKGFGTAFWFLTLPLALKFAISKIKNRAFLLAFILAFIPLLYITWRIVQSIHVNARFLIWAFALTIPLAAYEISKSKRLLCFSILIFLFVFVSNFPKMARTYHPDLDLRLIYKIDKRCDLRGYDKSFLRYNIWLKEFSGISAFIQYLSRNFRDRLKIKCVGEDMKEIWCPFLLYGEVKDGKMNDVSSCLREVKDPDLVVVIHIYRAREPEHIRSDEEYALLFPGFQRIYSLLNTTARGAAVNYEVLMKGDLIAELHEKIDFWKTNCSELFKN